MTVVSDKGQKKDFILLLALGYSDDFLEQADINVESDQLVPVHLV